VGGSHASPGIWEPEYDALGWCITPAPTEVSEEYAAFCRHHDGAYV
jgi:hypothetical protein